MTSKTAFKKEVKAIKDALQRFPAVLEKFNEYERAVKKWYGDDETRHYTAFMIHLLHVVSTSQHQTPYDGILTGSMVILWARLLHNDGVSLHHILSGSGYCETIKDYDNGCFNDLYPRLALAFPDSGYLDN
jgi:hypothetical protein